MGILLWNLRWVPVDGHNLPVLCDFSVDHATPRPVIPLALTQALLQTRHNLSHPGGNAFLRDLRRRFIWRGMASQAKSFCRACLPCQRSKIMRHIKAPLAALDMPDHRFMALHLDLVGPLPASEGFTYLLTVIDRYSRWVEAFPLESITAQHCANVLLRGWIARFGVDHHGQRVTIYLWSVARALPSPRDQTCPNDVLPPAE